MKTQNTFVLDLHSEEFLILLQRDFIIVDEYAVVPCESCEALP